MQSNRLPSNGHLQSHPEQLTVALLGKRAELRNIIGNMILGSNAFDTESNILVVGENSSFKIINTPDFFDEESLLPDQHIIDLMALSHPGPDLFILTIDPENTQEVDVVAQISKLQHTFGERITEHLVVTLPDMESFHSPSHLKEIFNIWLAPDESMASECRKWCSGRDPFLYDYKNYSQDVVTKRKTALEKILEKQKCGGDPLCDVGSAGTSAHGVPDNIFNIVLLGLTGTGKSASANTILAVGNTRRGSRQLFRSEPSSVPVTTQCEFRIMEKPFGVLVRLADTPDFFHDQLENSKAQVEECKKYCQPGHCVVLLVIQLGRFTDAEEGILEKLEDKLGWKIRESTIVLLTHGEDLKTKSLPLFIEKSAPLKNIVESCGSRYHLFNNSSEDPKQVINLIKKIPNYYKMFTKLTKRH
ncbi:GTPase IMAP family member 8-like [Dicentrarchus labrax]|uniref:GTPase IMAP family member 8-like n=1 Tax=Dicentrarchus labrax TaxID=13489 RepID=UPI0021F64094|nr:GTPase IMAP family member 8-like [Dicentrarchus labrax]